LNSKLFSIIAVLVLACLAAAALYSEKRKLEAPELELTGFSAGLIGEPPVVDVTVELYNPNRVKVNLSGRTVLIVGDYVVGVSEVEVEIPAKSKIQTVIRYTILKKGDEYLRKTLGTPGKVLIMILLDGDVWSKNSHIKISRDASAYLVVQAGLPPRVAPD